MALLPSPHSGVGEDGSFNLLDLLKWKSSSTSCLISLSSSTPVSLEWRPEGKPSTKFVSSMIYELIRQHQPLVDWHRIIWIKRGIPKHNYLAYLINLNRCPTKDRLIAWHLEVDPMCPLCNREPESRNHLFFECQFSTQIWSQLATKLRLPQTLPTWDRVLQSLLALSGDKHLKYLTLLAWQSNLYEIWSERNTRLHRNSYRSADNLLKRIDSTIRDRISAFRYQNNLTASSCLQLWFSLDPN
ncbi:hypothetical protein V5N11_005529 [Cardamine amara subsp. amara]|uniref:Reverse transcriptase zinc-binding domain-containing protein n=1 Tax=Cardamine amara subsp. amara TaxID=228776 RepID=A0ABD0ZTW6_CARAN